MLINSFTYSLDAKENIYIKIPEATNKTAILHTMDYIKLFYQLYNYKQLILRKNI